MPLRLPSGCAFAVGFMSAKSGSRGRSMNCWDSTVQSWRRWEQTGQMWSELSTNHWPDTWPCRSPVHLHACLETLFPGPTLDL